MSEKYRHLRYTGWGSIEHFNPTPVYLILYLCLNFILCPIFGKILFRNSFTTHTKALSVITAISTTFLIIHIKTNAIIFFDVVPELILFISHPLTILHLSFNLNFREVRKEIGNILILVYVGCPLYCFIVGSTILLIADGKLGWDLSAVYGLAIGSTDFTDVNPRGNQMDYIKNTLVILQVESILSSDLCYIVMVLLLKRVDGIFDPWLVMLRFLFVYFIGGILFGYIIGFIMHFVMELIYDDSASFCFFMISTSISVFVIADYLDLSSVLATFFYCHNLSTYKLRIGEERSRLFYALFETINRITQCIFLFIGMFPLGHSAIRNTRHDSLLEYFTLVLVGICARFLVLLIMYAVFRLLRFSFTIKQAAMMSWLTKKDVVQIVYFVNLLESPRTFQLASYTAPHTFCFIAVMIFLNSTTVNFFMRIFGISGATSFAAISMNKCMHNIRNVTNYFIFDMRVNSILADVNWKHVHQQIYVKHPYGDKKMLIKNNEVFASGKRQSYCSDCHKVIFFEPTKKEYQRYLRDAKLNILKLHQIFFTDQFKKELISKNVFKILSGFLEIAISSKDLTLNPMLFKQYIGKETIFLKFEAMVSAIDYLEPPPHPRNKFRKAINKIVMHPSYEISYLLVTIFGVCVVFLDLLHDDLYLPCTFCNIGFLLLLMIDCTLKIISYSHIRVKDGLAFYLNASYWDRLDVIVKVGVVWDLSCDLLFHLYSNRSLPLVVYRVTVKSCSLLRICKLLKFILLLGRYKATICRKLKLLNGQRQMFVADIGQVMIYSYEEVLHAMSELIEHENIRFELIGQTINDKSIVTRELNSINANQSFAFISSTCKTNAAIRTCFYVMRRKARHLLDQGLVDIKELTLLENAIENYLHSFLKKNITVLNNENTVTVEQLGYVGKEEFVTEYLMAASYKATYKADESLMQRSGEIPGIVIVLSGTIRVSYDPDDVRKYKRYGALPGTDHLELDSLTKAQEFYLVSGNGIGEMAILTRRLYQCQIRAHEKCTVLIVPESSVYEAFKLVGYPGLGLQSEMWLYLALPIIEALLWQTKYYRHYTKYDLDEITRKGFVPDLQLCEIFRRSSCIQDVVLVEGMVLDVENDNEYIAPCHLPRFVRQIMLIRDEDFFIEPQLFILPLSEKLTDVIVQPIKDLWTNFDNANDIIKQREYRKPIISASKAKGDESLHDRKSVQYKANAVAVYRKSVQTKAVKPRMLSSFVELPTFNSPYSILKNKNYFEIIDVTASNEFSSSSSAAMSMD